MFKLQNSLSTFFCLSILASAIVISASDAFSQVEKMDNVEYRAPSGWKKTPKDFGVVFSTVDNTEHTFCILTLYGSEKNSATPKKAFSDKWNELIVKAFGAEANPKTEVSAFDGWTLTAAMTKVAVENGESYVMLSVVSGYDLSVSIVALFNSTNYVQDLDAFVAGIKLDKTSQPPIVVVKGAQDPTSEVSTSMFGIWSNSQMSIGNYVSSSGTFVGSADVSIMEEYDFRSNGTYLYKFFGSGGRPGLYYSETTGSFKTIGRKLVLTPRRKRGGYSGAIKTVATGPSETFEFYIGPNKWEAGPFLNLHKDGNYYLYADYPYDYFHKIVK